MPTLERFSRPFRTEVLDHRHDFTSLEKVRLVTEDWRHRYNHDRPHEPSAVPIRCAMAIA